MAKQKEIILNENTPDEKKFLLQHPGALWYSQMSDRCTNRNGVLLKTNYMEELLKNVIVEPQKTSISSFEEDLAGLEEVIGGIEDFLRTK